MIDTIFLELLGEVIHYFLSTNDWSVSRLALTTFYSVCCSVSLQVDCFHVLRKGDPPFVPSTIFLKQGLASFVCIHFLIFILILKSNLGHSL